MTTEANKSQILVEAEQNAAETERVLKITVPLLVDSLLMATGGNVDLVDDLMKDVANIAGQTGQLAVARRRVDATRYEVEYRELHPDNMSPRQESGIFGNEGAQPSIFSLDEIKARAKIVSEGKSPIQRPNLKIIP